jgi:hypothetical protein
MSVPKSYLPFKDYHVVQIRDISPDQLKFSAKKIKKDREKISHTSILNFVAKSFGIKGGFSEYSKVYETEILPFLLKNNLTKQVDICAPRKPGMGYPPRMSKQKIAERIFVSNLPVPERIFTGYDFDYENTISDGYWYFNQRSQDEGVLREITHPSDGLKAVSHNLEIAKTNKDYVVKGHIGYSDRSLVDFILGGYDQDIQTGFNLIGDDLVQPREQSSVIHLYNNDMEAESYKDSLKASCLVMDVFKQRIDSQDKGWVEIIPFNKNLVFLKGSDGDFDIVFSGLKSYEFQHKFMQDQLKISDVPYFVSDYAFNRWNYFEYKGWCEKDEHESECNFYSTGGKSSNYPGSTEILISYHKKNSDFESRVKISNKCIGGFKKIKIGSNKICISSIVSINDFYEFIAENESYLSTRVGDELSAVNADEDKSLAAACTWFDALAYCSWYTKKYGIPVRLLTSDEYLEMRKNSVGYSPEESIHKDLIYTNPKTKLEYTAHPPYMAESEFQSLHLTYRKDIPTINLESGLEFLNSNDFSEWMSDKTCVRSASLASFYRHGHVARSAPPLDSSGKYKHQKIGFRICYDIS